MEKLLLNVSETAKILGLSRPTVYELLHRADFPSFRVGSRRLIPVDGLRRWIDAQTNGGEAI